MSGMVSGMEFGFGRVAAAALQVLSDAVEQEVVRRGDHERAGLRAQQSLLTGQVSAWMEQFAGAPLWERRKELGLQLRAELLELLGGMEPQLATALLCRLPGAERRGYTAERLAVSLGVAEEQILAWEGEAYARLGELVTERTPLLAFLKMRAGEGVSGQERAFQTEEFEAQDQGDFASLISGASEMLTDREHENDLLRAEAQERLTDREHEDALLRADSLEKLLELARDEAAFDLRNYVGAALELRIRQAFHRFGLEALKQVEALFAEEDRLAVALVGARMKLETGGEEETNHG